MDDEDRAVRNLTYTAFVELGRAPTFEEVAGAAGLEPDDVLAAWRRLHDQHALVLDPAGTEIWMANPFSAVPTPFRVQAGGRWWFANCAWDAFGICAALHTDGRIETPCPDCDDTIAVDVLDGRPADESVLFHSLVPAQQWWDDIGFT